MPSRRASSKRFVVRGRATSDVVESLGGTSTHTVVNPGVVIVTPENPDDDPRATQRALREKLGPDVFVAPVLVDDHGGDAYPTGRIQVRFATAPSDEACARFATKHGLSLVGRNKYQAAQCSFEPTDADAYLPDLVKELAKVDGVRRAWEATEARYERG